MSVYVKTSRGAISLSESKRLSNLEIAVNNLQKIEYKTYTTTKNFVKGTNNVVKLGTKLVGDVYIPENIVSMSGILRYNGNYHCIPVSPIGGSGKYLEEMLAQLLVASNDNGLSGYIQLWLATAWNDSTLKVTIGYDVSKRIYPGA